MKKIIILIGSPRKRKSNSEKYTEMLKEYFLPLENLSQIQQPDSFQELEVLQSEIVYLYETELDENLVNRVYQANVVVMVQPLYVDCLPSRVLEFMQAVRDGAITEESVLLRPALYFVINCGFLEYKQNDTAIKILESFCNQCSFEFCGGFSIGSGGMIIGSRRERVVRQIMEELAEELCRNESEEDKKAAIRTITYIDAGIPKFMYKAKSNKLRKILAAKSNLSKRDLKKMYFK